MINITEEELLDILKNTSGDDIAIDDYIDDETGEIFWSEGETAKSSQLWTIVHPEDVVENVYIDSDPWNEPGMFIEEFLGKYDADIVTVGDYVESSENGSRDYELNYPLEMQFPTDIKRKDGNTFIKTDIDNLEYLEDALNEFAKMDTSNLKFIISPNGSKTNADVSPAFS